MTRAAIAFTLCAAVALAIPAASPAEPSHAVKAHHTKLMPYVEIPVDHGLWLFSNVPCNNVSNAAGPLMWFPSPPREDKFLDCAPGFKKTGADTYQDILCPAPDSAPSTYKVIGRTRMLVDGAAMRLCPVSQLPEPFRTTVLEQLAQERARR
jgi:hypothetical protein